MSKSKLVVLVGLPGAGKTEYAKRLKSDGFIICSSDEMRERMYGDINDQEHNREVFDAVHKEIHYYLGTGYNVVFDACNINAKKRMNLLRYLSDIDCIKEAHIIAVPYEIALEQNKNRDRVIPEYIIRRAYKHWQTPALWEGFDKIELLAMIPGDEFDISKYEGYDQNNPHHNKPLMDHMEDVAQYVFQHISKEDPLLIAAALRHDSGKPFCEFKDKNGVSHFYGHEGVGAYDALLDWTYNDDEAIEISQLITYHMYPFSWHNDESNDKYKKLWGNSFYNRIMLLHKADVIA